MFCFVGQITNNELEKIKIDPKRVQLIVNAGKYFEQPIKRSFFQKMFGKNETPATVPDPSYIPEPVCDLDKSWHAIHFLLTGDPAGGAFPLNFLATGGEEIGEDVGYGPVRFLNSDQTIILNSELEKISVIDLTNRFDHATFVEFELYPVYTGWTDDDKTWLADYYKDIKAFINNAVTVNKGICIYIV